MQRLSFCLLVLANISLFGAADSEQQLRRRTTSSTIPDVSERTQQIMKNHNISKDSHPIEIREVAQQISDDGADYLFSGVAVGACDAYSAYLLTKGCSVVPVSQELAGITIFGAASLFCLFKSCQQIRSSRELFILADPKKNN